MPDWGATIARSCGWPRRSGRGSRSARTCRARPCGRSWRARAMGSTACGRSTSAWDRRGRAGGGARCGSRAAAGRSRSSATSRRCCTTPRTRRPRRSPRCWRTRPRNGGCASISTSVRSGSPRRASSARCATSWRPSNPDMGGTRLRWPAALLAVAALVAVTWIRLRPLGLHGLDAQAAAEVRDRLAGAGHLDDAAVDAWIAEHPARFARKVAATRDRLASAYTYRAEDGRDHVYLGDLDSYLWLRRARQYLRTGTTCDMVAQGDCRDLHTLAPVGSSMRYARSIHIAAIVAVQRIASWLRPRWPLPSSAMLVPVIVGAVGGLPAFALG